MTDTVSWLTVVDIEKLDEDERVIYGWASVTADDDGKPVVDLQGDVIDTATIRRAAHGYLCNSRVGLAMHSGPPVAELVESVVMTPEVRKAMGLPAGGREGWWVAFRINDSDVWAKVKSGQLSSLSIGGTARRATE